MKLRNRQITRLALILVLSIIGMRLNALSLTFKQIAKITHQEIKVADLVDTWEGDLVDFIKVQNIVIEQLPYQNRMLNLRSDIITQKIRLFYPDVQLNFPRQLIAVRWEDLTLNPDVIKQTAETFLNNYYSLSTDAEINIVSIPRVTIPHNNVTLAFEKSRTTDEINYIRLDGKVFDAGQMIAAFNILARVQETRYVYQANKSIKKGQKIDSADFTRVSITTNPNTPYLFIIDPQSDLVATKLISRGSILRNTDISEAPAVVRNDVVNVAVQSSSMLLTYQAISKADGWLGDKIMLQNPDSKQIFYAQVVDKNKVLINLNDK